MEISGRFDEPTGQILSEKSVGWGTSDAARKAVIKIAPAGTKVVWDFRSLGFHVNTTRKRSCKLANVRATAALETMNKIRATPNPRKEKLIFAELCSMTKLTYGCELTLPSKGLLDKLRTATIRTLWKTGRMAREPNLVFILALKTHKFEPLMACYYTTLKCLRDIIFKYPDMDAQLDNAWLEQAHTSKHGPLHVLKQIFDSMM